MSIACPVGANRARKSSPCLFLIVYDSTMRDRLPWICLITMPDQIVTPVRSSTTCTRSPTLKRIDGVFGGSFDSVIVSSESPVLFEASLKL